MNNNNIDLNEMNRQVNNPNKMEDSQRQMNEQNNRDEYQRRMNEQNNRDEYQRQMNNSTPPENKPDIFFGHDPNIDIEKRNWKNKRHAMKHFNSSQNLFGGGVANKVKQEFVRKYNQSPVQKLNCMRNKISGNSTIKSITNTGNKYGRAKNMLKTPSKLKAFLR